jgi:hypothetical protein
MPRFSTGKKPATDKLLAGALYRKWLASTKILAEKVLTTIARTSWRMGSARFDQPEKPPKMTPGLFASRL